MTMSVSIGGVTIKIYGIEGTVQKHGGQTWRGEGKVG